jgi:DNA-binding response OmpR family regulator
MPLVLAVDDESSILRIIELQLVSEGFEVETASTGEEAVEKLTATDPDIVVLDVVMPGMDGLQVLAWIRKVSTVPVILLTGQVQDRQKISGLNRGADDYVTKPFNPEELAARVRAVLRSTMQEQQESRGVLKVGDVTIDLDSRLVLKGNQPVSLTRTEWNLLNYLAQRAGKVILGTDLLRNVWGPEYVEDNQMLRVWISRLRSKLEGTGGRRSLLTTISGVGYRLNADEPADEAET